MILLQFIDYSVIDLYIIHFENLLKTIIEILSDKKKKQIKQCTICQLYEELQNL